MKRIFPAAMCLLAAVGLAACGGRRQTIELQLEKQAPMVRSLVTVPKFLKETGPFAGLYPRATGLPEGWKAYFVEEDFPQLLYQGFCAGKIDTATCMRYFNAWQRDTADYSAAPVQVYMAVAFGRDDMGAEHVMFDTDGDCDFADESDYLFVQRPAMVKMAYERAVGKKAVPDVTWAAVSDRFGRRSLVMHEMTRGTFTRGRVKYACSIIAHSVSYSKQGCKIVIADDNVLSEHELEEYVRLGDTWYRLDSLSPDGRFLRMTHAPDAAARESVQVGFRPYSFTAGDMAGRTVRFPADFAGKYVLLDFWAMSCGPCVQEIRNSYPDVYARFKDYGFEIVGVADNTAADLRGFMAENPMPWVVIADRDNGNVRQEPYGVTSFPTLILIGPDGRILEKGENLRGKGLELILRRYMPGAPAEAAD